MKKSVTVALVALAGGLYASTDADVFPHCQKWGFRAEQAPVEAFDPTDISEIMHGPWLTMPREDSMRVTWISRSISGGGIAYREKGTDARNLVERIWDGMLDLGATTFWEGFDPSARGSEHWEFYKRPFGKSLCHAWGSAPVFLLRMFNGEIK